MAGSLTVDTLQADSTSTLVLKNGVANTPPTIQDSAGTQIGTFCRAWVNFNGTGTVAIRSSFNVTSITDTNVGRYVVNLTNAMSDANYCALAVIGSSLYLNPSPSSNGANTTTACSISVVNIDPTSAGGYTDASDVSVSIFR